MRENRVKAPGIPWTKDEQEALKAGISPDDVRNGVMKPEDVVNVPTAEKPYKRMTKAELIKIAQDLKINFDPEIATKGDLVLEIEKITEQPVKKPWLDKTQAEGEENA